MPTDTPAGAPGSSSWESGTQVGRFTLLTPLAYGGMAELWLARQTGLKGFEKLVVIKRMSDALASNQEYVDMFLSEARLAAQLTHPNVVQIYELGEEAGALYIVMEYLDGEDLASVRRTGQKYGLPLLDHFAVKLVSMAAEGLHYAHSRTGLDGRSLGIIHRDISPQNLIVTFDGGLKVVDFGIAKAATQHTNSGKLKGKLSYMSPEQARGEHLDGRSDLFALGVVLFELVTRTRLLPKMNDLELLDHMSRQEPPFPEPSSRRADIPPGLEAIITRMLSRKRDQRYANARELHEALEGWLQASGKRVSAGDLADYMRALFARRIQERQQLIETAIRADLTPTTARHLSQLAAARRGDAGSRSQSHSATGPGSKVYRAAIAAVVVLSVVVLGMGAAIVKRLQGPPPPPPAAQEQPAPAAQPPIAAQPSAPPEVREAPPALSVSTVPSGAALLIDGKPGGSSPQVFDALGVGDHVVEATLPGYEPSTRTVKLSAPGEKVNVELSLVPLPAPPTPTPTPAPTPDPEPKPAPPPSVTRAPPRKRAPEVMGKLSLKTVPWTTVYLGKKKLGDTPLVNMALPAGKHVLRLVNPEAQVERSVEVEIRPNDTTTKKLVL